MLGLVFPDRLTWLGLVLSFSVLPVVVVYSTRAAPLFLAVSALILFLAEVRLDPRLVRIGRIVGKLAQQPLVVLLVALSSFALLSTLWSPTPDETFAGAARVTGAFFLGGSWCALMARFRADELLPYMAFGVTAGLLAFASELLFAGITRSLYRDDAFWAFEINRSIQQISPMVVLFAALAALAALADPARQRVWRVWAAIAIVATVALALMSESRSTFAFWLLFGLVAVAAGLAARAALVGVVAAVGAALFAFPWAIQRWHPLIAEVFSLERLDAFARSANVEHRLIIWADFARIIPERLWTGWGLKAERALELSSPPFAGAHWHPHSLALELWTGLGTAGVVLAAAVLVAFAGVVARYDRAMLAWATALFAGLATIWLVSHGTWETWWLAVLALTLGTLLSVRRCGPPTHTFKQPPISLPWRPRRSAPAD
jgi:O-antigen ligase